MVSGTTKKEEGSSSNAAAKTMTTKLSTSAVTCSSLDSVNESETVQKAHAGELEQDTMID